MRGLGVGIKSPRHLLNLPFAYSYILLIVHREWLPLSWFSTIENHQNFIGQLSSAKINQIIRIFLLISKDLSTCLFNSLKSANLSLISEVILQYILLPHSTLLILCTRSQCCQNHNNNFRLSSAKSGESIYLEVSGNAHHVHETLDIAIRYNRYSTKGDALNEALTIQAERSCNFCIL